jgi:transcriptional regulator with XRE-family HTH domain
MWNPEAHEAARAMLADILCELRDDAGLRQQDVADRLGLNQSFVSKYESGKRHLEVGELQTICKALDMSLVEVIDRFQKLWAMRR